MQEQPVNSKLQGIADCKDKQLTSNKYGCRLVMLRNNAEWTFYKMSKNNSPPSEWSVIISSQYPLHSKRRNYSKTCVTW